MADMTLSDLSKTMADIDFTMLFTRTEGGQLAGRPMSNNGDVAFEGDSYFFTFDSSRTVSDIERDKTVAMSLRGNEGLLGKPPIFIAIEGQAELIRDKTKFTDHWQPDLERWFEGGVDTPGLVLLKAHATRIHYWDGTDEGEVPL